MVRRNNDFAELKVHLIFRKQVPLLHIIVLILCDEGAGLVAVLMYFASIDWLLMYFDSLNCKQNEP